MMVLKVGIIFKVYHLYQQKGSDSAICILKSSTWPALYILLFCMPLSNLCCRSFVTTVLIQVCLSGCLLILNAESYCELRFGILLSSTEEIYLIFFSLSAA